jgi:type II restriction/modification system DNA methylase subunit YeeA
MPAPDSIVKLVQRFEDHRESYRSGKCDEESLRREIESTDREIDRLVYELYGLTEEEIKIVEGG